MNNPAIDISGRRVQKKPSIKMIPPGEIMPSLFGAEVNPVASDLDEMALRESIAANGVQIPVTAGRITGQNTSHIVKGTRRHKHALELGIPLIPVEHKEYVSLDEMREDALRDNLERRQLSTAGRAELANSLWRSYESALDKKEMAAKNIGPRKRAAIAGGISEGSLASYRYVLDSGDTGLIAKMRSGALSIDKACREAKKVTDGKNVFTRTGAKSSTADHVRELRDTFNNMAHAAGILREVVKRGKATIKQAKEGQQSPPTVLIKKMQAITEAIAALASSDELADKSKPTGSENSIVGATTGKATHDEREVCQSTPLANHKDEEYAES